MRKIFKGLTVIFAAIALCVFTACNRLPQEHVCEWEEWEEVTPSTCTVRGVRARRCKVGGEIEREPLALKGHRADKLSYDDSGHWYVCEECGKQFGQERHTMQDGLCTVCDYQAVYTEGLEYRFDEGNDCYRVVGIGSVQKEKIIVPDYHRGKSVAVIAPSAFRGCTFLTAVTLPDTVKFIGQYAFSGCINLEKVNLPAEVTEIESGAFSRCFALKSIVLSDSIEKIDNYVFSYCKSLESIVIPEGVTSIGWNAFVDCGALKEVVLPNSVTQIGENAFSCCDQLEKISFGSNLQTVGEFAFSTCNALAQIYYAGDVEKWQEVSVVETGNARLLKATVFYYSEEEPELTPEGNEYNGNYWHYVGGAIAVWKYQPKDDTEEAFA